MLLLSDRPKQKNVRCRTVFAQLESPARRSKLELYD